MTTFVAVVDAKGIAEAAKRLGVAKSVVSQRIKHLEKRIGVQMFERGRHLHITEAGQLFYERCVHILMAVEHAETDAVQTKSNIKGRLRLSAPMAFTEHHLAPILAKFAAQYPEIELDVETTDSYVNLNDDHYDAAIRLGRLGKSSLVGQTISVNRKVLCASPIYLERAGIPQHPDDLCRHDGILYLHREPHGMLHLPVNGELRSFRIRCRMRTDSGHQLVAAALEGLGIAALPTFLASAHIESGALSIVLPEYSPLGGEISVVYRQGQRNSNKIRALVDFLKEAIGQPPEWDQRIWSKLPKTQTES